ncbi:DUF2975 domain-containing protein [Roseibium sediminicola]|uniref:DUF2975 domain-containing protein n=1 Tax=Roseibium sediminicola TaxID=2933272 RepID=A0ABT0GTL9_9HYPH|nr:DUF2975 domain-containing protein [Roseibium sp. CAU 1639]MCK7612785.1 DUF2975 domain-containing protein [Roseibium sp. CAU 1639]
MQNDHNNFFVNHFVSRLQKKLVRRTQHPGINFSKMRETAMSSLDLDRDRRLDRIRRLAGVMKWVVAALFIVLVLTGLFLIAALIWPEPLGAGGETIDFGLVERPIAELPLLQRLGLAALTGIAFLLLTGTFWHIRRIFAQFQKTEFFSPATLSTVFAIGIWLIAFGALGAANDPICCFLASLDLPKDQRIIEMNIDGGAIFFTVLGTLMLLFGWILREAALIADENRQFV